MINLTLNKLKRPALQNLVPKFGTKVEKNDINKGGLSTAEVDLNMTLPFELMREIEVSSSDTTTKIHYDARVAIVGSDPVTLTLDQATYKGCTITIKNRNTEQATIILSEDNQKNLEPNKSLVLEWDGTTWIDTALVVDSTVSEESHNIVTSAAVYQKATEITEAYTQAIADETNSRGEAIAEEQRLREEAITAAEQKITEETTARTEADTALGTRIDEEVTARTQSYTELDVKITSESELLNTNIGQLESLATSDKTSAVAAINELHNLIETSSDTLGEVNTLKESISELGTEVEALKSAVPSEPVDSYTKTEIDGKFDNVYTKTEVDDRFSEQGGGNSATNCEQFTFVVDSNEALADWANNDRTKGQDYTSVLIRKGTWTSTVKVNLTTTGTKVIKGEAGNKIVFSGVSSGLSYNSTPAKDCYMLGLNIEIIDNGVDNGTCRGFYRCANMYNCTSKVANQKTKEVEGFSNCINLTNCFGEGSGYIGGYGFNQCINLTNCEGKGASTNGEGYGFAKCNGVSRCKAGGNSMSGVFSVCYASNSKTSDYACADTPAGGFNDTTNPAA